MPLFYASIANVEDIMQTIQVVCPHVCHVWRSLPPGNAFALYLSLYMYCNVYMDMHIIVILIILSCFILQRCIFGGEPRKLSTTRKPRRMTSGRRSHKISRGGPYKIPGLHEPCTTPGGEPCEDWFSRGVPCTIHGFIGPCDDGTA